MLMAVSCWFSFLKKGTNPTSTTFQLKAFVAPEEKREDFLYPWCTSFYRQAVSPTHSLVSNNQDKQVRCLTQWGPRWASKNKRVVIIIFCYKKAVTAWHWLFTSPVVMSTTYRHSSCGLLIPAQTSSPYTVCHSAHCPEDTRPVETTDDVNTSLSSWARICSPTCELSRGHVSVWECVDEWQIRLFLSFNMTPCEHTLQVVQVLQSNSTLCLGLVWVLFSFFFFSIHQEHKYFETLGLGGNSPGGKALCWVNTCILPPSPPFSRRAAGGFPPFQSHINI